LGKTTSEQPVAAAGVVPDDDGEVRR
jgi:hypothetical protein